MIKKINLYVVKLKKNFFAIVFLLFTACLLLFSKSNLSAVKSGLALWANSIVPSLFPFFVSTELLMHTNVVIQIGNIFNKYMKPLFNVRGEGAFAFIMGIISGYPVGAKIASNFRMNNICSKEECERLLSFTNNSGPLFIVGTVGISMFKNSSIGILLFISHILSCITVGIIFRFWKKSKISSFDIQDSNIILKEKQNISFSNLGEILTESISSATSTIFQIGGFVVIFSSIVSILKETGIINILATLGIPICSFLNIDTSFLQPLISGFFEITNGINAITRVYCKKISINIIATSFLLGFGGISILLQVFSIISKTDLSIKPYLYGKLLHGIISSFFTYIFINTIPFFNFDL